MGKKLTMNRFREVTQLTTDGASYPFQGDPFFSVIEANGEIIGFEIVDIEDIEADDIPEINGVYDMDEMGIKNSTIKDMVLLLRNILNRSSNTTHRKTA
jgi:hypothetical protein